MIKVKKPKELKAVQRHRKRKTILLYLSERLRLSFSNLKCDLEKLKLKKNKFFLVVSV